MIWAERIDSRILGANWGLFNNRYS